MMVNGNTFRVFVSSTFSDLVEERNALHKDVFPRLKALCEKFGYSFQAIDLRWGVSDEASLDQKTMQICLNEIELCQKVSPKPNFIILLGDRYGWVPLKYSISEFDFKKMCTFISAEDLELVLEWYKTDYNCVPPSYCLKRRTGIYEDISEWSFVEDRLRSIISEAAEKAFGDDKDISKAAAYKQSATFMEIARGLGFRSLFELTYMEDFDAALEALHESRHAREHIFCFNREIEGVNTHPLYSLYMDTNVENTLDFAALRERDRMKDLLKKYLRGNFITYKAHWQDTRKGMGLFKKLSHRVNQDKPVSGAPITDDHIQKLCNDVYNHLSKIIMKEIEDSVQFGTVENEISFHKNMCRQLSSVHVGRNPQLLHVEKYIDSIKRNGAESPPPLLISGEPGIGKSALMAAAIAEAEKTQDIYVIYRFIGTTFSSTDLGRLKKSITQEYMKYADNRFPVIFVDNLGGLNLSGISLDDFGFHFMSNMYDAVPTGKNTGLVFSCDSITAEKILKDKKQLLAREAFTQRIELERLSREESDKLLAIWLLEQQRTITFAQKECILYESSWCGNPLYLKIVSQLAGHWSSDIKVTLSDFGEDLEKAVMSYFNSLYKTGNYGPKLIKSVLSYIAASRKGLSENELLDVLSLDEDVYNEFVESARHSPPEKRLPIVLWARLYNAISFFLKEEFFENVRLINFSSPIIKQVLVRINALSENADVYRKRLCDYFSSQPPRYDFNRLELIKKVLVQVGGTIKHGDNNQSSMKDLLKENDEIKNSLILSYFNLRKYYELIYQYQSLKDWESMYRLLCEKEFILTISLNEPIISYWQIVEKQLGHRMQQEYVRLIDSYTKDDTGILGTIIEYLKKYGNEHEASILAEKYKDLIKS